MNERPSDQLRPLGMAAALMLGAIAGVVVHLDGSAPDLLQQPAWLFVIYLLHAMGLYGSVYEIDHQSLRDQWARIGAAVSVGVAAKIALVAVLYGWFYDPATALAFATIVAQIDPSLAAWELNHERRPMAVDASNLLRAWSSLDNPITAVFAAALLTDAHAGSPLGDLAWNTVVAALYLGAWRLIRARGPWAEALVVLGVLVTGAWGQWMLAVSLAGFVARPAARWAVQLGVDVSLHGTLLLLGFVLERQLSWQGVAQGALLAVAVFGAQMAIGWTLGAGFAPDDRRRVALAQQNGITSITLALLFEAVWPTVTVIAPAVLLVNLLHVAAVAVTTGWSSRE